jgi:phosphate transport system permease protein
MSEASKSELSQKTKTSESYRGNLSRRHRFGRISLVIFQASTLIGIVALTALVINIIDGSFGYAAIQYSVDPETFAIDGIPLNELPKEELQRIFQENVSKGLYRRYESEIPFVERTKEDVYNLVQVRVVDPQIVQTWGLIDSLTKKDEIIAEALEKYPESELQFVSWLTTDFIRNPQSSEPEKAGVRTAILGSLFVIAVTIFVAFPLGVFAAIYLE